MEVSEIVKQDFRLTLPIKKIFRNKKNNKLYVMLSEKIISSTNSTAGKQMVLYTDEMFSSLFCREADEFYVKFTLEKDLTIPVSGE